MEDLAPGLLKLDSPRWMQLEAHFGNAGMDGELLAVPTLLAAWHESVGTYGEEYAYEPLYESFLHQQTIRSVAYAVVPHLVSRLSETDPDRRQMILDDLAVVDETEATPASELENANREIKDEVSGKLCDHFVKALRERHPKLPLDLQPAYRRTIAVAKEQAGENWGRCLSEEPGDHNYRRHLRFLRDSGVEDYDILAALEVLTDELETPIYGSYEDQVAALESIGWRDRMAATRAPEHDELCLKALRSLGYYHETCTRVLELLRSGL